jgi:hypothetical protein
LLLSLQVSLGESVFIDSKDRITIYGLWNFYMQAKVN